MVADEAHLEAMKVVNDYIDFMVLGLTIPNYLYAYLKMPHIEHALQEIRLAYVLSMSHVEYTM